MKDYRYTIDQHLSKYCEDNNIEYSTDHCEAFVIKFEGFWRYIWYDCNEELPIQEYLKVLKLQLEK